jgi:hypothetical protein
MALSNEVQATRPREGPIAIGRADSDTIISPEQIPKKQGMASMYFFCLPSMR